MWTRITPIMDNFLRSVLVVFEFRRFLQKTDIDFSNNIFPIDMSIINFHYIHHFHFIIYGDLIYS